MPGSKYPFRRLPGRRCYEEIPFAQRCDDDLDIFLGFLADITELRRFGDAAPHQPIISNVVEARF